MYAHDRRTLQTPCRCGARYQRLAAQLFDALQVSSIDEVMPALARLQEGRHGAGAPVRVR
jgi:hypothetical protein